MTVALVALAAVLTVIVLAAVAVVGRAWRASERRERALLAMIERNEAHHVDVLDRVLYAAGKPWKDTADRPDEPEQQMDVPPPIVEDPQPGGDYGGNERFDFDTLEADIHEGVFVEEMQTERERLYDTGKIETAL